MSTRCRLRLSRDAVVETQSSYASLKDWSCQASVVADTPDAKLPLYVPPEATKAAPIPTPKDPKTATLSTLMAAGAALGHSQQLLAPSFTPYVYGNRAGLSIIDLEQTLPLLRRAAALVRDVVEADGVVLFVGTKQKHRKPLQQARERLGDNGYSTLKWWPGTLTNAET